MANQDILFNLWIEDDESKDMVTLREIGKFAEKKKGKLNSRTNAQISASGLNYAVHKFILDYCSPVDWSETLLKKFEKAKDSNEGNYGIWKKYPNLKVNIKNKNRAPAELDLSEDFEEDEEDIEWTTPTFEKDIHQFMKAQLDSIENGLSLYEGGNEFSTEAGRVDILAIDNDENLVAIEIKRGKAGDKAIGQIKRYMGGVEEEISKPDQEVRGIIVAQDFPHKIKYSIKDEPIELKEYKVKFEFEDKEFK